MPAIALLSDSACDLPTPLLAQHAITLVPLFIRFGDEEFPDRYELREMFWARYAAGEFPQTAASPPSIFADAYTQALENADQVLMITVTGVHSSAYHHAQLAAQAFQGRVQVFDSRAISLAQGLLVLRAARLIAQGAPMPEILEDLYRARERLHLWIYLDSLDAIQRSGRLASAMQTLKRASAALSIRILLDMREGKLHLMGIVRSPRKGIKRIIREVQGRRAEAVAVAHTRALAQAHTLADAVAPVLAYPREHILIAEAGPILGAHGGFRALGLTLIESPRA